MKVAFMDRDGTIVKDYPDNVWSSIEKPEFLDGSIDGLRALRDYGFEFIIITNQYLIEEGFITLEDYNRFHSLVLDKLKCDGINVLQTYYCPHKRSDNCECMKPNPGMINKALKEYMDINLDECILVGDSKCDLLLAKHFGLHAYMITESDLSLCEYNNYTQIKN